MKANDMQVGGKHYQKPIQHWDWAGALGLDYFQGAITKYIARWKEKNGLEDLKKAQHYLTKYIELVEAGVIQDPKAAKDVTPMSYPMGTLCATCGATWGDHDNLDCPTGGGQFRKK